MPFLKVVFEDKYIKFPASKPYVALTLENIGTMTEAEIKDFIEGYMIYWQDDPKIKSFEVVAGEYE